MTDQYINETVARKLGWTQSVSEFYFDWWVNPKTQLHSKAPPDFCHSIEAAWNIVEFLLHNMKPLNLNMTPTMKPLWSAGIRLNGDGEADTAPMAICLAFLKLEGK